MKRTSRCLRALLTLSMLLVLSEQTTRADLTITSITGTFDLGRYAENTSGNPPDVYVDGTPDSIIYSPTPVTFTDISAATNTLSLSAVSTNAWTDTLSGGSVVTFTGLNSAGDNWTGLLTNTNNAATFISADSISVDFSILGLDTPGTFSLVPEPSLFTLLGPGGIGLVLCRRRRATRASPKRT